MTKYYPTARLFLSIRPILLCLPAFCVLAAAAAAPPAAHRPGCSSRCGDVDIPYPFGIGDHCAIHTGFNVICTRLADGTDRPFVGPFEVTNISVPDAKAWMKMDISWRCYDFDVGQMKRHTWGGDFTNTPFRFSYEDNKVFVLGCKTLAYMRSKQYIQGCYTTCSGDDITRNGSCSAGAGCCALDVPKNLGYLYVDFNENYNTSGACGYIVVMENKAFNYSTTYRTYSSFWYAYNGIVPVVMDWRITYDTCESAKLNPTSSIAHYACVDNNSECVNTTNGPGYRCKCLHGYQGNPYVSDGCTDVDECLQDNTNNCTARGATACENTQGSYICLCPPGKTMVNDRCMPNQKSSSWVIPVVGASVGLVILIVTITCAYLTQQRRKLQHIQERYTQQYGGMLFFEEIKSQQGFRIFTEAQLQEATNKFSEKRVLGKGGHATVYKGFLEDDVQIAVKRCNKVIDEHQKLEFGKEILILSQINHRNIVKLLGCCLEVRVPMLVYEFIPDGTLFELIHRRQISLSIRMQIAHQSAEALAYLHSCASPPIFHGDVKSTNILVDIDRDYTVKVSDFGASIVAPTDESQFLEKVQGTYGYLDPEYMQTGKLTEKSDVYSFGVVLLELLTRKAAFMFEAHVDEKSLALRFISAAKKGKLEEILDDQIKSDKNMEVLEEVAELAMQCLEMLGANRPSMKEVSERLNSLRKVMQHAQQQQQQQNSNPEEMESLLGESSLPSLELVNTAILSIEKKAARSLESGR